METLPPEIHLKLYSLACTDDGTTGCSLSAVSRRIRQLSAEYRYQSLAVCGPTQISRLLQTLRAVPPELRRIRFLFIYEASSLSGRTDSTRPSVRSHAWRGRKQYSHRLRPPSNSTSLDNPVTDSLVEAIVTASLDDPDMVGLAGVLRRNVDEILSIAHETLEILSVIHFDAIQPGGFQRYFNTNFPALIHLTIKGPHEIPDDPSFAPALRMLHVTDDGISAKLAYKLATNHPHLSRLRISRVLELTKRVSMTVAPLVHAMGIMHLGRLFAKIPAPPLMSSGVERLLLVEPAGARQSGGRRRTDQLCVDMLNTFNSKCRGFRLLPNHPGHDRRAEAVLALYEWVKCCQGISMSWGRVPGKVGWDLGN